MTDQNEDPKPWEKLEELVEKQETQILEEFIDSLPIGETARALSRMNETAQNQLMAALAPSEAADLLEQLSDTQAAELVQQLEPSVAAEIVAELPSNQQADLLGDLRPSDAEAILAELKPQEARELRRLTEYSDDETGGLMVTEFLAFPAEMTVANVIDNLRANADEYRDYQIQYTFVVEDGEKLAGVLRLRDLLLARPKESIRSLMIPRPLSVNDHAKLDELREFFDEHHFLAAPVVDADNNLMGLVTRSAVEEALGDRSEDDYRKSQGIVKEELRTMPLGVRSRRRLAWLSVNIFLNVIAASVIAVYQETLAQVIALAVFLPIISDMSGCSGNQAVAVSMRELSLGLVRPSEIMRVWLKEVSVGLINGFALGLLIAAVAFLWKGNPFLGLVVGTAMMVNTIIAVSIGGTLPLLMRRLGMDPALASGPILTTITDMCGFFIVLSMAAAMLSRLV